MKKQNRHSIFAIALVLTSIALTQSSMGIPHGINYQAYLTNADGVAIDTNVTITFAAFNVATGGVPLWNQTQSVEVNNGLFTVTLANPVNPFPPGLFNGPVYIGLFVAGEEMLPRRELTSAGFAYKASDADTLNGVQASTLDESAEVAALQSNVAVLDTRVSTIEAMDVVQITGGGATTVSGSYPTFSISSTDNVNDADSSPTNEIQSLALTGNILSTSLGGGSVSLAGLASPWVNSGGNLYFNTGKIGIGDASPLATLTIGDGDKLQISGAEGDLTFNDDLGSLTFANADSNNAAMINMFQSGTANSPRMVLSHSSSFPTWGLRYDDTNDSFDWIGDGLPVMHVGLAGIQQVGVGTFVPEAKFHVVANSSDGIGQIKLTETQYDFSRLTFDSTQSSGYWDLAARSDANLSNADLNFFHSVGGNILSLDGRGRVGINNITPNYTVDINGNGESRAVNVFSTLPSTTTTTFSYGVISNLGQATNTGFPRLFNLYGFSTDTDAYLSYGVYGHATNAFAGNYGVYGVASTVGSSSYAVYASGNMYSTGSYLPSDAKLKSGIHSFQNGLASIMKLRPTAYTYDTQQYDFMNLPQGKQYGFVAQDFEESFPDLVKSSFQAYDEALSDTPEGQGVSFKAINYTALIPVVVSAMQEQQQVIDDQKERIESLENRLAALESMVTGK